MSHTQKDLWYRYHDIVISDSTYKKNVFDLVLHLIVGVDNDNKTRLLACSLIDDEQEESFVWIFQNLKIAVSNIYPLSIYTDNDLSMINAIKTVFLETMHFLCIYYMDQNIQRKLKQKLGTKFETFHKEFFCARNSLSIDQFEFRWTKLIKD